MDHHPSSGPATGVVLAVARLLVVVVLLLLPAASGLKISTSLLWIEHTPQPYAIQHFYKGASPATLTQGGVADLPRNTGFDLAANAATQGLKTYHGNRGIRLIYVICEVPYRLIAHRDGGRVRAPSDLRGRRIGAVRGSSSQSFVEIFMAAGAGGLASSQYTMASGNVCMRAPCGAGTFPRLLRERGIDAFGVWEPAVELAARDLGGDAVVFQNASVYREVYGLWTTTARLASPATRRDVVEFVRALERTRDVFANDPPQSVYDSVARAVGMDASVVRDVWKHHRWTGRWGPDLVDLLEEEDRLLQRLDRRAAIPRADLEKLLDPSVLDEISRS